MRRRIWPAVLAASALVVFASYLLYTQFLVRKIRQQGQVHTRIFSLVQRGILSSADGPDEAITALLEIQPELDSLKLPIVVLNAAGNVEFHNGNMPFPVDGSAESQQRLAEYAAKLARNRANRVDVPGSGTVIFGDPPIIGWLRWIPWLQTTGALVLVLVALAVLRADARAERERLWSAMARELAHQMGTPLSSLEGWLEVLALPPGEREAFAEDDYIARVMSADVERLERVSRRFELIGKPPALDIVQVADVVAELREYFAPRLPKFGRGITLRAKADAGLPAVRANRVLLAWAFENVIKNAVDALGGRGGRIMIVAHEDRDGAVHVHIADNGPGIPAGIRDRIFDAGVSTKAGGWGVGLSLTKRIVQELHGGRISVRARRGRGTVFDIALPPAGA
jgi:signal transduction histidine kinase